MRALRDEMHEMRFEIRSSVARDCSATAKATQAVAEAQKQLLELSAAHSGARGGGGASSSIDLEQRMKRLEVEVMASQEALQVPLTRELNHPSPLNSSPHLAQWVPLSPVSCLR